MTSREDFARITKMLRANYSFMEWDKYALDVWYVGLQNFDLPDLEQGVRNYIAFSAKQPTVADIIEAAKAVRDHKEPKFDWSKSRTVRCPLCQDEGCISIIYPTGKEAVRLCSCEAGQKKFGKHWVEEFDDDAAAYYFGPGWTKKEVQERIVEVRRFHGNRPIIYMEERKEEEEKDDRKAVPVERVLPTDTDS